MKTFILFFLFISLLSCTQKEEYTQEEETKSLNILYQKIKTLADSKTCEDSDRWSFTALGHKACGGPKEFIAYSQDIDETLFLELVKQYTKAEKEYNQKWDIVSDCSVPQQPTMVVCSDGIPTFEY